MGSRMGIFGRALALIAAMAALACVGPVAARAEEAPDPTRAVEIETGRESTGALASGPDGSVFFVVDDELGRVGADGAVTETKLSEGLGEVQDAVVGPAGEIWATTPDRLNRIAPDGTVTSFGMPPGSGRAGDVAIAPDGSLWVEAWASQYANERSFGKAFVVRFRPDGKATRFALPGPAKRRFEGPGSIVAGPGGDIWFAEPAFRRVGRIAPDGGLTEYPVRLRPSVLVPDGAGKLWFVGEGGVGKIDGNGRVEELRAGEFEGFSIGNGRDAVVGPEGDLWWIAEATRILRATPSGHLDVIRGTGSPTPTSIAATASSVLVGTAGGYKGFQGPGPILRFTAGLAGVEVRPGVASVDGAGKVPVHLSCGGSSAGCSGVLTLLFDGGGEATAPFALAAQSDGEASVALPAAEAKLLAEGGYLRVSAYANGTGIYGGGSHLTLGAARAPRPRPGRPVVMPLPEGAGTAGLAPGAGRTLWAGADIGRLTRITTGGKVSTVAVPGLEVAPIVIGADARRDVWFAGSLDGLFQPGTEPVIGRLAPDGKLWQRRLPRGPGLREAAVGADGEAWVLRADGRRPGTIEHLAPSRKLTRFATGAEPGAIAVGRDGAWFAQTGPKVVHITGSGRRQVFPIPHGGFVSGLALGRRGAVWLSLSYRKHIPAAIARLEPDGRVVEHRLERTSEVGSLAVAPNGEVWFSSEFPRRIGRLAPSGKVTVTRRGAAAGAGAVAIGPDGNAWFIDYEQRTLAGFRP